MAWTTLMVKVSPAFKQAVEAAVEAAETNMSQYVREAVAARMGYDVSADAEYDGRGRPKVYATDDQRAKARRKAEREREAHKRAVVEAVMRQERLANIDALEKWLAAKGISVGDDATADVPEARSA